MDLTRHLKISGTEAIKLVLDGGEVFDAHGAKYAIDKECGTLWYESPFYRTELDRTFNHVLKNEWYVPRPFDVRQSMRDSPNEWVGAYMFGGTWYKVGFDNKHMVVVETRLVNSVPVDWAHPVVEDSIKSNVDACVPIQEARR